MTETIMERTRRTMTALFGKDIGDARAAQASSLAEELEREALARPARVAAEYDPYERGLGS